MFQSARLSTLQQVGLPLHCLTEENTLLQNLPQYEVQCKSITDMALEGPLQEGCRYHIYFKV